MQLVKHLHLLQERVFLRAHTQDYILCLNPFFDKILYVLSKGRQKFDGGSRSTRCFE